MEAATPAGQSLGHPLQRQSVRKTDLRVAVGRARFELLSNVQELGTSWVQLDEGNAERKQALKGGSLSNRGRPTIGQSASTLDATAPQRVVVATMRPNQARTPA